jgi:hypothetical protein
MQAVRDLVTLADGTTHDVGRWFAVLGGLTGIALQVFDTVVLRNPFSMLAFGGGMAALATGVGAMLKLKADTEPKESP